MAINALALDPAEHELYLGTSDGRIVVVSLVTQPTSAPHPPQHLDHAPAMAKGRARAFPAAVHDSFPAVRESAAEMVGHAHAVRCVAVTPDGASLLSGSDIAPETCSVFWPVCDACLCLHPCVC